MTLLRCLDHGRPLCDPTAISPAIAVDEELHSTNRYVVIDDGFVEDPLDPLPIRLQTRVELAEGVVAP